ncbi:hypothetical protein KPL70_011810 [Citrus sinensis]|nr:uncharacterized protein LOC102625284 isoform X1 [Citrus sinensis]KAH9705280.1 hypothetical protein KPL70_011810 [Citrus sinensis]KAH9705281.1 hypothetical protein KPL70_011810 [Citrus sinensis]
MGSLTGIGFRPLDEEIIDLLKKKRLDPGSSVQTIKEIDFYSFDPWELPGLSEIQSTEDVWYFFCKPKYKGAKRKRSGQQRHRKTKSGTWKMTGGGSEIKRKNSTEVIGDKDYLVFIHDDAASEKANTKWLMHEIAIADDPLYKENFVVCRLEGRNWDKKLGVSTPDKHQSSQDFASSSSINVVEDISLESAQPPDRYLVSTTNQVVENIFLKTQLPPSENLFSCNEDSATTSLDSGLSPRVCLIPYSGNHVAENTSTGLQLVPHDVLESLRLPDEKWATYSIDVVEKSLEAEPLIPAEFNIHGGFNGLNNDSFLALQSSSYLEQESSYSNGPSFGCDLLNSQIDSGHVIAFSESQQLPNHLISCFRNHVAENTYTGLQLVPHDVLESLRLPDEQWATYSVDVVENSFEAEPRIPVEFNTHGGFNGLNNDSFLALQSPTYLEQESSYSNGPSFGCDLLNYQIDSGPVIAFSELQQLPNHLISCFGNHVAENTYTGLQLVPHDILESLRLPDEQWATYSVDVVENSFEAEPRIPAEFNTHGGFNGLNNDSFLALQSPTYLEQESSYSNGPSFGCDLLNSQIDSGRVIAFSESQQLPNHLISCFGNHVAENTYTGLQLVPHHVLESLRLPDEQWATYSVDVVENSFEAEPRIPAEFNTHGGFNGLNNDSFLALQSPTYLEQESSYSNGPSFGCDLLNSQIDSGRVIAFSESQQLPNHLISCSGNYVAENTSTGLQQVPHGILESQILSNQYWAAYSTSAIGNSFEAEPQLVAEVNTHGGYNGLNNASLSALQSPIYPEEE